MNSKLAKIPGSDFLKRNLARWVSSQLGTDQATPAVTAVETPAASRFRAQLGNKLDEQARLVQRFLDLGRAALLLRPAIAQTIPAKYLALVRESLTQDMALTAAGEVFLTRWCCPIEEDGGDPPHVESTSAFLLDRWTVTNRQYQQFVAQGAYEQDSLWDPTVWPRVAEFRDATGQSGPRYWRDGTFAPEQAEWPVVGVNWFEASAFARWAGKRLPTDAEWMRVAACPTVTGDSLVQRRFPWGDVWDPARCNLWFSGLRSPCPVTAFAEGNSANGVQQLLGNVWEWTASDLQASVCGHAMQFEAPLKSLRGGAFDTYFENQSSGQLHSGDLALARRHNVGFRCALSLDDLVSWESAG